MSDVPHLRFPEFSGEWGKCKLEDCVDFLDGLRKPIKSEDRKCEMGLYPYYGASGIIDYIDEYIFDGDYILLSEDGANILDRNYRVAFLAKGKIWVNNHAHVLLPHTNIDIDFLSEALERLNYAVYNTGTTMPKLNQEVCRTIGLYIPPIKEQNKIGALLSLLNERIATQNKIIEKLESLIKGLSQRLLSPKQGWTSYKLDELCQIKSGYSGIQVSFQTAYKVSRIETISNHCINMSRIGFVKEIPQEYKLSVGDILFSNINSVQYIGNTAFIDKDYGLYHGMNLLRIVPDSRIVFPRFIHLLLCSERLLRHFQSICNKAVSQASINQTSLGKTMMTIPSYKEQQHICCIIESVERKLDIETSLLKMLQYQKQYLLRQMFI